jgi:hypothetical protein
MVDLALNPEAQDAYWAAAVLRTEVGREALQYQVPERLNFLHFSSTKAQSTFFFQQTFSS